MKALAPFLGICAMLAMCSAASAGMICDFATSGTAVLVNDPATMTWNAGGWVDVTGADGTDYNGIDIAYAYGDITGMTHITMDLIGDWDTSASSEIDIVVYSTGWAAARYKGEVATVTDYGSWTTVTVAFNGFAGWDDWGGTAAEVISDAGGMSIYTWPTTGGSIDNLGFVPEPVSLSLLAVGSLALLRRRRK